ncbi:MAG: type I-U CRISPR-associated protein Cas5/Cas6 [Deltaproteobacteria bacterium]|nr:type I-U CRISPR-associated protein Cas5/Cas6 [Deltaproteobacteria bacterium]
MFGVVVELLAGRYAAATYNDRDRVEWPPHPARFFSALVATWGEHEPRSEQGEAERAALEWLEEQAPPEILADAIDQIGARSVLTVFVPVNDQYEVSEVDRDRLDEAEAEVGTLEGKQRSKVEKEIEKLRKKLLDDTQKAIAAPKKFGVETNLGARVLPEGRVRQPRTFPVAHPKTPSFAFVWPDATASRATTDVISGLLARLVRLGHSSTMVRASVATEPEIGNLRATQSSFLPDEDGGAHVIRWVGKGQLKRLCEAYDRHREVEPRVLPARFVRYSDTVKRPRSAVHPSVFAEDFVVLARTAGPRLPITSTAGLARQFRRALISCADQPVDEMISGHKADGSPSELPHLAIAPLPYVGNRYADGSILGIGVVLPRSAGPEARRALARALVNLERHGADREIRINLSESALCLQRVVWEPSQATLRTARWTRASRSWATATPIALDRNPGDLQDPDPRRRHEAFTEASRGIAEAITRIGLPAPIELDAVRGCVLPGNAKPRAYPRFPPETSRTQRVLVHARIVFAEPVSGPLLIGAGRYQGLGLCMPLEEWR